MECEVSKQRAVVWWYTVVVRAWERSGLAGWRRGAGTNEGVEWLPRAQGQPKAQLNGHKSCLVVSTSRARPSTEWAKPNCRPTTLSPPHVNNWLVSQAVCQTRRRHRLVDLEDLPYNLSPIYQASAIVRAPPTAVIAPVQNQNIPSTPIPSPKWSAKNPDAPC